MRDYEKINEDVEVQNCILSLENNIANLKVETDLDIIRGIEGQSAKSYFFVFDHFIVQQSDDFKLYGRTKRPPLDKTNAILSFLYTVCTNDIASALECVGLDPYIGFFHTLRPGRASLACDIMEEFRSIVERLVITIINLKIINKTDFYCQISGATILSEDGRKKVITAWQNKKKELFLHPVLREKVQIGLLPYIQANLLAKYIRGEIKEYPNLTVA